MIYNRMSGLIVPTSGCNQFILLVKHTKGEIIECIKATDKNLLLSYDLLRVQAYSHTGGIPATSRGANGKGRNNLGESHACRLRCTNGGRSARPWSVSRRCITMI